MWLRSMKKILFYSFQKVYIENTLVLDIIVFSYAYIRFWNTILKCLFLYWFPQWTCVGLCWSGCSLRLRILTTEWSQSRCSWECIRLIFWRWTCTRAVSGADLSWTACGRSPPFKPPGQRRSDMFCYLLQFNSIQKSC